MVLVGMLCSFSWSSRLGYSVSCSKHDTWISYCRRDHAEISALAAATSVTTASFLMVRRTKVVVSRLHPGQRGHPWESSQYLGEISTVLERVGSAPREPWRLRDFEVRCPRCLRPNAMLHRWSMMMSLLCQSSFARRHFYCLGRCIRSNSMPGSKAPCVHDCSMPYSMPY